VRVDEENSNILISGILYWHQRLYVQTDSKNI